MNLKQEPITEKNFKTLFVTYLGDDILIPIEEYNSCSTGNRKERFKKMSELGKKYNTSHLPKILGKTTSIK